MTLSFQNFGLVGKGQTNNFFVVVRLIGRLAINFGTYSCGMLDTSSPAISPPYLNLQ